MQVASLFLRHGVRKLYATVTGVYPPKTHLFMQMVPGQVRPSQLYLEPL